MSLEIKPFIPFSKDTFWFWEIINIIVPIIGILFFNWSIYTVVFLFWIEILMWGCIGILKILSSGGTKGDIFTQIFVKLGFLTAYCILYIGLFTVLFSFTLIELDSNSIINSGQGIKIGMMVIVLNYLYEYIRSELLSGRFKTRYPIEAIFERFIYALPLAAFILFAVIPLAKKFQDQHIEKLIAIGIIVGKFIMASLIHYIPDIKLPDSNQ